MHLRFWGVRGSIPTPYADRLRYGGNTTCLEIDSPSPAEAILIDCGSGARALGDELMRRHIRRVHILLTHFHWDHIQGLPFFAPLFVPGMQVIFYSDRSADEVRGYLATQMAHPYFPMPFADVPSRLDFRTVSYGRPFSAGPIETRCFPLCHPQGAAGYRLEYAGGVLVHASDHEYGDAAIDAGIRRVANGAQVLVMDAQYTPEEYAGKVGWGHSSYAHAAKLAQAADVAQLVLFHHDPAHDDAFLDDMLLRTQALFSATRMACEGEALDLAKCAPQPVSQLQK